MVFLHLVPHWLLHDLGNLRVVTQLRAQSFSADCGIPIATEARDKVSDEIHIEKWYEPLPTYRSSSRPASHIHISSLTNHNYVIYVCKAHDPKDARLSVNEAQERIFWTCTRGPWTSPFSYRKKPQALR